MRISLDCSFLAHVIVPSQITATAIAAMLQIEPSRDELVASPALALELPTVLLRLQRRGILSGAEANNVFREFESMRIRLTAFDEQMVARMWAVTRLLGQTDVFDASGYVVAEVIEGEFWTSDRRFANAAASAGLPRVRFVP